MGPTSDSGFAALSSAGWEIWEIRVFTKVVLPVAAASVSGLAIAVPVKEIETAKRVKNLLVSFLDITVTPLLEGCLLGNKRHPEVSDPLIP
jgi:uncharacterized membrane protein